MQDHRSYRDITDKIVSRYVLDGWLYLFELRDTVTAKRRTLVRVNHWCTDNLGPAHTEEFPGSWMITGEYVIIRDDITATAFKVSWC